jgi:dTDP-glucose 4,6-dehydratase
VYDEAKRFGEALTMAYRRSHGVDTAIVRIFNTFGPRMRPNDGRAIPTFIRQALAGEPLTVAGDGAQTRSVCYVDDLIEGLLRLLHSDLAGPVNIGNPGCGAPSPGFAGLTDPPANVRPTHDPSAELPHFVDRG